MKVLVTIVLTLSCFYCGDDDPVTSTCVRLLDDSDAGDSDAGDEFPPNWQVDGTPRPGKCD